MRTLSLSRIRCGQDEPKRAEVEQAADNVGTPWMIVKSTVTTKEYLPAGSVGHARQQDETKRDEHGTRTTAND